MALRQAKFLSYGDDDFCAQTMKFLEDAGVIVEYRDIEKKPLTEDELWDIMGHLDAGHFLNPASDSYEINKLAEHIPERGKLIEMVAKDHTLLRRPIIRTPRLLTVGCDKQKISEMLRLNGEINPRDQGNSHRDRGVPGGRMDGRKPESASS